MIALRRLLQVFAALAGTSLAGAAHAQDYPSHTITIIVPFAAGGGPDIVGRRIAAKLSTRLGVPVIIDNRDGAGGRIGTSIAARAAPDGYTLLLGTSSALAIAPALYPDLTYDSQRSFAPVSLIVQGPLVLAVRTSLPVQNLQALLAYAKQNPGKLNFGSAGIGSVHQLAVEMLQRSAGVSMTHIPYKGGSPAWSALQAGEVDLVMDALYGGAAPTLDAGKARPLAVTGLARISALPQTPTFQEEGVPSMDFGFWWGMLAPKGTPAPIVARLSSELAQVVADPELKASFAALSLDLKSSTPDTFKTLLAGDMARWHSVVEKAGITAEK
jgi:tripartite-type tricarboxylate transporter receptor subunit TctC